MSMQPSIERDSSGTSSSVLPTPSSSQYSKPQRVLACVLCHQRKVKCDRKFPCSNCIKSQAECVPATVTRRRARRRVPEQELLERLRRYEKLLHRNNIGFESLDKDLVRKDLASERASPNVEGDDVSDDDQQPESVATVSPTPTTTVKSERTLQYEAKNIWRAMKSRYRDDSDDESTASHSDHGMREEMVRSAWDHISGHNIFLMLGQRPAAAPLTSLHPDPVQIFSFWQVYLDNVNPLLKVMHAPSMQGRIVGAMGNLANISTTLEALMFSIYCISIVSLSDDQCHALFGSPKQDLLRRHQFACQQALLNSNFLRSRDRDCLTALYLYILSVGSSTDPLSLSCALGIAFRIARRMGLLNESISSRCTPFEAEMRRRLWWSLILFDTRIGELADYRGLTLDPTWDCKIPLNVNDSDLRPEMKEAPIAEGRCADALFAVVRSEMGDHIRYSNFHLDFTNPALKSIARNVQHDTAPGVSELDALEKKIEDKYLKFCDPEVPLHFMTIWMTRGQLAKSRIIEYYAGVGSSRPPTSEADSLFQNAIAHAFSMLECDTKVLTSPLTIGYRWLADFYFPMPAYAHIVQELRKRPFSKYADQAWELMSENFDARCINLSGYLSPLFVLFGKTVLPAWEAREAAAGGSREPLTPPRIVSGIKQKLALIAQNAQGGQAGGGAGQQPNDAMNLDNIDLPMSMPMGFSDNNLLFGMGFDVGMGAQVPYAGTESGAYHSPFGQPSLDVGANQVNWATMNPSLGGLSGNDAAGHF